MSPEKYFSTTYEGWNIHRLISNKEICTVLFSKICNGRRAQFKLIPYFFSPSWKLCLYKLNRSFVINIQNWFDSNGKFRRVFYLAVWVRMRSLTGACGTRISCIWHIISRCNFLRWLLCVVLWDPFVYDVNSDDIHDKNEHAESKHDICHVYVPAVFLICWSFAIARWMCFGCRRWRGRCRWRKISNNMVVQLGRLKHK